MKKENYAIVLGGWSPTGAVLEKRKGPGLFEFLDDANVIHYPSPNPLTDEEESYFSGIEDGSIRETSRAVYMKLNNKTEPFKLDHIAKIIDKYWEK